MKKFLLALPLVLAAAFAFIYWQNSQAPALGVVDGKLKPTGDKPNDVSSQSTDEDKRVDPLPMKNSLEDTRAAIFAAIENYAGATIMVDQPRYIYAVFTTPLMKYNDDVEFYIDTTQSLVHFRSASRAGYSDRGLNRQRYEALDELYRSWPLYSQ
ncbi:MAG: DUF1499 domain-containing protein [Gammaproteobacteria bacterium]|nr:DUF1499 domain-containing protein [Gammaproteobacteria bacterium]NND40223.1 DUF1499 domain-containing protein [Pseudomonadales bacterium]MBT8151901.1 DUF1499 domain-containing protein [Gammaproteobacteria bacterium]NNL11642.1 DUF1499 domain-containing protein [Pseudomonadales bacterium]NNM12471.1 DUF1499 domain-containing protein [Pseudomonadales bacterium]